jgi:lamin B
LSGWQIVHNVNETETVYKFHRTFKLAPGASVSVWSAGKTRHFALVATPNHPSHLGKALIGKFCFVICFLGTGTAHEPPSTLVMKEQRWFVASEMKTQLMNDSGEVRRK